ncbi:MAG TPA: tetratricopeptide repeat protein [Bryobacteraceae bacterium]|nr:tetratricopeptide repeat protein [Bryobacteraceae bacterium]
MQQLQFPQALRSIGFVLAASLLLVCPLPGEEHYEYPLGGGPWIFHVSPPRDRETRPPSGTVSVDLLRYPLSAKARRMLEKAVRFIDSGDHTAAIQQLEQTLAKCPSSAAYAQSMLGVEYMRVDRYSDAAKSLQQAVDLLPHDFVNHSNLGLSLARLGEYEQARQELRRALELDPQNANVRRLLAALPAAENR